MSINEDGNNFPLVSVLDRIEKSRKELFPDLTYSPDTTSIENVIPISLDDFRSIRNRAQEKKKKLIYIEFP